MKITTLRDIDLISSSIPESTYKGETVPEYDAAETYSTGALVCFTDHKIYESVENSNIGNEPPLNPLKWTSKGSSDRYLMFDEYVATQSQAETGISFELNAGDCNSIGLFNIRALRASLKHIDNRDIAIGQFTPGVGWTDNSDGSFTCDGSQTGDSGVVLTEGFKVGTMYRVTFTVSEYVHGYVSGVASGMHGPGVNQNGVYSQFVTATESNGIFPNFVPQWVEGNAQFISLASPAYDGMPCDVGIVADADFVGKISDISINRVTKHISRNLNVINVTNGYEYCFAPFEFKEDFIWEFPSYSNSAIVVDLEWKTGDMCQLGTVAIGRSMELGKTQWDFTTGINDYSKKVTDNDLGGATYLSQGNYSKKIDVSMWLPPSRVTKVSKELVKNRGIAAIYDFNEPGTELEELVIYGFYQNWDINVPGPNMSRCTFSIQGLI